LTSVGDVVARACAGEPRAIGRLISWVEDGSERLPQAMALLAEHPGRAHVIGITGPPGVGKSTMTSALVAALRSRGNRVGVIAVDPSSPFSGGALLGDRIRMHDHATDPGVFIRSMASRGHLGGLAATTPQAVRVLAAAGFDMVLIETVGVGQSEVEVAASADTTLVLLAPGMGDGIQAAKAGILEIGDVLCVNKADREGAQASARELRHMLDLSDRAAGDWRPMVVTSVAGRGEVDDVVAALDAHRDFSQSTAAGQVRRHGRAVEEIVSLALARIDQRLTTTEAGFVGELADQVVSGDLDPFSAADRLLAHLAVDRE
jgi:LAO/AO transport system kinase